MQNLTQLLLRHCWVRHLSSIKPPVESNHPFLAFKILDFYRRSPKSSKLWYRSNELKCTICSPSEGVQDLTQLLLRYRWVGHLSRIKSSL